MIWIDVTPRAARRVRALAAQHADGPAPARDAQREPVAREPVERETVARETVARETVERFGLRIAVDREEAGDGAPQVTLSLSSRRAPTDLVLPRFGFDVLVHTDDAPEVDGLRIDFVQGPQGSGFVIDRIPRQRSLPSAAPLAGSGPLPASAPPTASGDEDLAEQVDRALEEVRPTLRADGGDVELVSVAGGVAYVRLDGACSGCSAALLTLTAVVEKTVVEAVPGITRTVLVA